ncbi:hypothetical protein COCC4DRAFT_124281 [Bipolaris maydis ATCC 48331]|uniref:Uncharacterized protein n=2 Tax=Cochliobolus heterostrophus TaxID=5016 RepID=M2V7D7_COCH5|nr:uncharacterized protein COCC4DRAFT_124281 [Bipolaris maydis ATCC 48331]EMD95907.1 hypothetical protein COCHEDRAFT_1090169 [Bipolaris maydis C5]KAJ5030616.1 hypothetical protein J3E73DRAFT_253727 [Bipolaris maydis]ENI10766.1 hypothetical protein COCC4DRAFT_124281 [Bipolaris maydis ATCC 48331]KAJ6213311.1 hypothetical protein PSV09DRAFT_1090169 [Bipolaris maydis]KAJ6274544.1 hypothetical protein PSV08DRAFT_243610 [Bipolaris maydis]
MPPYSTPAYYHPTSPTSHSLPSDEYKYLKRQQEKSRLQWHLAKKHILPPRTILSTSSSSSFPSDYSSSSSSSSSSFPSTSTSSSFSSSSSSYTTPTLPPYPPTPYQTQRLPHAHRVHISAVKNATRKALASVFDTGTTDHDMYHEWPSSRYEHRACRGVSSPRDVDEYYESSRVRSNRGSGESMRVRYQNMSGYGSGLSGHGVGGARLGSKFSFDSLDDA